MVIEVDCNEGTIGELVDLVGEIFILNVLLHAQKIKRIVLVVEVKVFLSIILSI